MVPLRHSSYCFWFSLLGWLAFEENGIVVGVASSDDLTRSRSSFLEHGTVPAPPCTSSEHARRGDGLSGAAGSDAAEDEGGEPDTWPQAQSANSSNTDANNGDLGTWTRHLVALKEGADTFFAGNHGNTDVEHGGDLETWTSHVVALKEGADTFFNRNHGGRSHDTLDAVSSGGHQADTEDLGRRDTTDSGGRRAHTEGLSSSWSTPGVNAISECRRTRDSDSPHCAGMAFGYSEGAEDNVTMSGSTKSDGTDSSTRNTVLMSQSTASGETDSSAEHAIGSGSTGTGETDSNGGNDGRISILLDESDSNTEDNVRQSAFPDGNDTDSSGDADAEAVADACAESGEQRAREKLLTPETIGASITPNSRVVKESLHKNPSSFSPGMPFRIASDISLESPQPKQITGKAVQVREKRADRRPSLASSLKRRVKGWVSRGSPFNKLERHLDSLAQLEITLKEARQRWSEAFSPSNYAALLKQGREEGTDPLCQLLADVHDTKVEIIDMYVKAKTAYKECVSATEFWGPGEHAYEKGILERATTIFSAIQDLVPSVDLAVRKFHMSSPSEAETT